VRLDDFDAENLKVRDQRGGGGGFRMGGGGKIGIGSIVMALIGIFVFGADPQQMLANLAGEASVEQPGQQAGATVSESCNADAISREACNTLASLNNTWQPVLDRSGVRFEQPVLNFYSSTGSSGCGAAQSAMGPFYCPTDGGIYIDTDFYHEMEQKLGAGGDFARMYVMAHEYGHHIQALTGTADEMRQAQSRNPGAANPLSVRLELQADCYAGVWAAMNKDRVEPGDLEEGLKAAHAIGDDTLMRNAGQRPVEAAFTHGTSEQRMTWLRRGLETGDGGQCDTFGARSG
jgi:predicted metalloprotease